MSLLKQKRDYEIARQTNNNSQHSSQQTLRQTTSSTKSTTKKHDLSFLYSRESDSIGRGISPSDSKLAHVLSQAESPCETARRKSIRVVVAAPGGGGDTTTSSSSSRPSLFDSYEHKPKVQHPVYTTTANEFGSKKPTVATCSGVRLSRSQTFSNSFNKTMFKNEGLNTSVTRSNVHEKLDS